VEHNPFPTKKFNLFFISQSVPKGWNQFSTTCRSVCLSFYRLPTKLLLDLSAAV
jgi:hypothetical protein